MTREIEFDKFRVWLRLGGFAMPVKRPRRRMVEAALRAGEQRYRVLVEHLPVGVYRTHLWLQYLLPQRLTKFLMMLEKRAKC